jgi:hypothetical protein
MTPLRNVKLPLCSDPTRFKSRLKSNREHGQEKIIFRL